MANDIPHRGLHLLKVWRSGEFWWLLGNPEMYIQLLLIGVSLALGWLVSILIARRLRGHLLMHPLKHIEPELLTKPLGLLSPLLALIYLSVARPIAETYANSIGNWVDAASQLCFALLIARTVVIIVRSRAIGYFIGGLIMIGALLETTGFTKPAADALHAQDFHFGQYHLSLYNLLQGMVILVIVFWLAGVLSRTLEGYLRRSSTMSYSARELIVKFFRLFAYFTALLITLQVVGVDLTAFAVFGGALGVGVGLGLQKVTANFVSGITILLEKSIQIGDLLEVGGLTGWVRQLNVRYALIETADGRDVMIPNEELVSTRVINWTHTNSQARIDVTVGVGYDSDPQLVIKLMLEAAEEHPRSLKKEHPPACFLREFGDSALKFLLIFWVEDVRDGRYGTQSDVMMAIMRKFKAAGIEIPYPQSVVRLEKSH